MAQVKPQPKSRSVFDYQECSMWIEQQLGYQLRDTLSSQQHFDCWCRLVGEEPRRLDNELYARYVAHPQGKAAQPEYRDYWHFLVDHKQVNNPCEITIGDELLQDGTAWQNDITRAFIAEFGNNVRYWVEW